MTGTVCLSYTQDSTGPNFSTSVFSGAVLMVVGVNIASNLEKTCWNSCVINLLMQSACS